MVSFHHDSPTYNISLSHGISGITIFLCEAIKKNSDKRIVEMLNGSVAYILAQEIDFNKYGSMYPTFSIEVGAGKSRLGWCYGDLGIGLALWRAAEVLDKEEWKSKALEIFRKSAIRLNDNTIIDTCICHGSAGLSMFFKRMHINSGEELFNKTTFYWLQRTLDFSIYHDGLASYKTHGKSGWKNDYTLLTGVAGVGLVLLSYLMNDKQDWDELFLLS